MAICINNQQFANLYWFRYDWFNDQKTKDDFKAKYGYDLGVPVNWSAYEDIAEFFTGRDAILYQGGPTSAWGNMDYGKKDPSLGWRYTDAWMSMAGMGDGATRTGCRWTNGASAWTRTRVPSAPAWRAVVRPTTRLRSTL